ncbi:MAG: type II toxin-antitoxin system VapC family toxin [Leptolyngbya sp. SIOISBB]|nr:type II toxin-antitoxin system VapC family toxin [Leptolyngbya sp. SIOISBB]
MFCALAKPPRKISLQDCSYSLITRIELLVFPAITDAEITSLEKLLSAMNYVPMSQAIADATIQHTDMAEMRDDRIQKALTLQKLLKID